MVDNTLALSILKSTSFEYKGESIKGYEEKTKHKFEYSIITHKGDWRDANIPRLALEYHNPLLAYKFTPSNNGKLLEEFSFLEISPRNVIVTAMYMENEKIFLRVNETSGKESRVLIKINPLFKIKEAWLVNALGEKNEKLDVNRNTIIFDIKGFSLETIEISLK